MQNKRKPVWTSIISFLLFFFCFILHYTDSFDISIRHAAPLALVPLLAAYSMFAPVGASAALGLIIGICMDGCAAGGAACFNSAVMLVIAVSVSVTAENLFNRNMRSAFLLSVLASLFYYTVRWAVLYAFSAGARNSLTYLLSYAFPSSVYTSLFIFPFYFLFKYFDKLKNL